MSGNESGGTMRPSTRHPPSGDPGFTLIELLVSLTVAVAITSVLLTAMDFSATISRVQSDVSDLQQSARAAQRDVQRMVRMAGRGGLPRSAGLITEDGGDLQAVAVTQHADQLEVGGERVVDATDVLTVRGAFTSPIFRVDASDPAAFRISGDTATLQIDSLTRSAFDQPLGALHALYDEIGDTTTREAILLVGSQGPAVYAVVELTGLRFQTVTLDIQNQTRVVERAILTLSVDANAGGHAADHLRISSTPGDLPANLISVSSASVIEEHRFFIREDFTIPGDPTSPLAPKLARARTVPGADPPELHRDGIIDIADNVFDLQVALGFDLDGDGRVDVEDGAGAPLAANTDEWLWNDATDDFDLGWGQAPLQHVRLTIVGQTQAADRTYVAPALARLENRDYAESDPPSGAELQSRRHRRRVLQSTVDPRNL
jgi:type II secretory pathway pseudopilin PulG